MTITSTPPVTPTAMKVIGLASNLNCNPANKVSLEQGDLKEVTKSTEVTTETTHDYTLSRSISVTAEQEVAGFTSGYGFSARSAHQLNFLSLYFLQKKRINDWPGGHPSLVMISLYSVASSNSL